MGERSRRTCIVVAVVLVVAIGAGWVLHDLTSAEARPPLVIWVLDDPDHHWIVQRIAGVYESEAGESPDDWSEIASSLRLDWTKNSEADGSLTLLSVTYDDEYPTSLPLVGYGSVCGCPLWLLWKAEPDSVAREVYYRPSGLEIDTRDGANGLERWWKYELSDVPKGR